MSRVASKPSKLEKIEVQPADIMVSEAPKIYDASTDMRIFFWRVAGITPRIFEDEAQIQQYIQMNSWQSLKRSSSCLIELRNCEQSRKLELWNRDQD